MLNAKNARIAIPFNYEAVEDYDADKYLNAAAYYRKHGKYRDQ